MSKKEADIQGATKPAKWQVKRENIGAPAAPGVGWSGLTQQQKAEWFFRHENRWRQKHQRAGAVTTTQRGYA